MRYNAAGKKSWYTHNGEDDSTAIILHVPVISAYPNVQEDAEYRSRCEDG